ncbi:hypothetical protein B7P43_G07188, partial [Cryptotermes secundus]
AGLTVNPAKVKFAMPHLSFLGHIVGPSGISVDPSRTDSIRRFMLQTDASSVAVVVVLLQQFDGELQPIAYASRMLSHPERKFSTYELECLAVRFGLEKFRPYLEHLEFDLQTDSQALTSCLSHPRQLGRIGRWVVRLSSFKFNVQHIRGTQNVITDALSRMYDPSAEKPVCSLLLDFRVLFEDFAAHQRRDP